MEHVTASLAQLHAKLLVSETPGNLLHLSHHSSARCLLLAHSGEILFILSRSFKRYDVLKNVQLFSTFKYLRRSLHL